MDTVACPTVPWPSLSRRRWRSSLDAVWAVRRSKDGKSETGRTKVRETVAQNGYDALVAAHSRAVARMSQDIADVVRSMGRPAQ